MAMFGQYAEVYRKTGAWEMLKRVYNEMNDDGILTWAAALAYSWMFALFPMIIFLLTLVAFIPIGDKTETVNQINGFIASSLPGEASKIITDFVPDIIKNQRGGLLTIGGLLTLWAASGGMATTMSALNRCYDITEDQAFYIARPKAVALTLVLLALVLFVVLVLPIGGVVLEWLKAHPHVLGRNLGSATEVAIDAARWVLALAAMFLIVALVYYFGPRLGGGFRYITPGGFFTVLGWIILGLLFKLYFSSFGGASSYAKTYGAVGGVVILLLFMYVASVILLLGAEVNSEFDYALYGRTGGLSAKPGERPGSATPAAEAAADPAPKATTDAPNGPSQQRSPSTPTRAPHLVAPAFTAKAGLTPEASRDKIDCPP